MQKVLVVLLVMGSMTQGSSLKWEYEVIEAKENDSRYGCAYDYINFDSHHERLRNRCRVAPKGWFSQYDVETACDTLYKQFDVINQYVEEAVENNQDISFANIEKSDKFIKREDRQKLVEIIFNTADEYPHRDTIKNTMHALDSDYRNYFMNALKSKKISELSKKYSK